MENYNFSTYIFIVGSDVGCDCDCTYTDHNGTITSPGYPDKYKNNVDCKYKVVNEENKRIYLIFTDLDIELHASCDYDFVKVNE